MKGEVTFLIDCHGRYWSERPRFDCRTGVGPVTFLFDPRDKQAQAFHAALFLDYDGLTRRRCAYPRRRRFALLNEPRASHAFRHDASLARQFHRVYTHDQELLARGENYVSMPFGTSWIGWPDVPEFFEKTRLVSFMGAEHPDAQPGDGHHFRNRVIDCLRQRGDVACFGKGIRWVDSVLDALGEFAFSIAMENCQQDDYFTEKLIDCFLTDTVPIYWGCHGVDRYFDPRGMLRFATIEELIGILDSLSWERYRAMLPFARANREVAVRRKWASMQGLYDRVGQAVAEDLVGARPIVWRPLLYRWSTGAVRMARYASGRCN